MTICGDTRKCEASEILAYRSDVLVHEATYEGDKGNKPIVISIRRVFKQLKLLKMLKLSDYC